MSTCPKNRWTTRLKPADRILRLSLLASLIALALAIVLIANYQIIARLGGFSVRWTEELARFFSIWGTFFSVPLLFKSSRLIRIDYFFLCFPRKVRVVIAFLQVVLIAVCSVALIVVGIWQVAATWQQTSPGLLWPLGLFSLPIVICAVLCLLYLKPAFSSSIGDDDDRGTGDGEVLL